MKKALVLGLLILGLGLAASAQLTGYWSTTLGIDPTPLSLGKFFTALTSTLKIDYALGGWTFGLVSGFDLGGFASQTFKVAGSLGAFSLVSNMTFDPAYPGNLTYTWTQYVALTQTTSLCPLVYTAAYAPRFLTWDVTAAVSIAGVDVEAYVLQDYSNQTGYTKVNYLWLASGTQTDSIVCQSYDNGMGWRLKLAGSFGGVSVTSYTYFNLWEDTIAADNAYYGLPACPVVGKAGVFTVGEGCEFPFTEEYLLIKGFTFGCATIDMGLSIYCTGFNDITFVVNDISLGGWATLDFGITFSLLQKSFATCISLDKLVFDCIVVELGFGAGAYGVITDNVLDKIYIHGVSFSQTFGGVKFSSVTEFDAASLLMSTATDYTYINGDTQWGFFVPYCGVKTCATEWDCEDPSTACADPTYWDGEVSYVECVATERYKLWEKFTIDIDADACCGGLFDLTVATYFGDHQVLDYAGFWSAAKGVTAYTWKPLYGTKPDTVTKAARSSTAAALACSAVFAKDYKAGTVSTLFDWAKTSATLGVGIGSGITLTAGFDITAFGWSSLTFGFKWTF